MKRNLVATLQVRDSKKAHDFTLNLSPDLWEEMDESARRQYISNRLAELVDIKVEIKMVPVNVRLDGNVIRGARFCCPQCGQQPLYEVMSGENALELNWEHCGELWPHRIHHGTPVATSCPLSSVETYGRSLDEVASSWLTAIKGAKR